MNHDMIPFLRPKDDNCTNQRLGIFTPTSIIEFFSTNFLGQNFGRGKN